MNSEIWSYGKGFHKGYTENSKILARIESWNEVTTSSKYFRNGKLIGGDFIFPSRLYNRVSRLLGLSQREKSINRVKAGQRSVGNLQFFVG